VRVAERAAARGAAATAIVGRCQVSEDALAVHGIAGVRELCRLAPDARSSMRDAGRWIEQAARDLARGLCDEAGLD